ncbi:MAG TPA: CHRD domain-containing protein [Blastocatellia bacterium]|nr:CHRD domain-containing protein [Blastocatellia bacterium]
MRRVLLALVTILMSVAVAMPDGIKELKTLLVGYQEVPAISTAANGEFRARISNDESEITYELSYSDLEGAVQQSHIHFGQTGVSGNIVVFLCSNLGNGPAGTQACPPPPATITGTLRASDMVNTASGQGIAAGEFEELISAIRAGKAYVNVHSAKFPSGEIRGQIDPGKGKEKDKHH